MESPVVEPQTVLHAQISFLNTHVALIHIPLSAYRYFSYPIAQLLLHNNASDEPGEIIQPNKPWQYWHPFVNVSITSTECSVVCPRKVADEIFQPLTAGMNSQQEICATISRDDFSVIVIDGDGLEAGQRVLDLTGPLALAGIPIFFITSYWSDFILVPLRSRSTVIHALENRGFVFDGDTDLESSMVLNPSSPVLQAHHRNASSISSLDSPITPSTSPPLTVNELQARTFRTLKQHSIVPHIDPEVHLVTCAGVKLNASSSHNDFAQERIQHGLLKVLTAPLIPNFFSLTLTSTESASLTLEKAVLSHFATDGEAILLGIEGPEQHAITLDLRNLPLESTGIVCGVASRLLDGMKGRLASEVFNMSYLSTAKAGHVIVYEDELKDALEALRGMGVNGHA